MSLHVVVEKLEGLQCRITVTTPIDGLQKKVDDKLKELAKTVRLPGFRPGKVPPGIVKREFEGRVKGEALQDLINDTYKQALAQEKLQPAGPPSVEVKTLSETELVHVATLELFPEVKNVNLGKTTIEILAGEVSEKDVDEALLKLREQHAIWSPVERASKEGDRKTIDFIGLLNGEAFEGGTAKGMQIKLGSNTMIPGFEAGLMGLKKGDQKDLELTFPEEYHAKHLAGKPAVFKVSVVEVEEPTLPEFNDDFAKKLQAKGGTAEALRAEIRKHLERELKAVLKNKNKEVVYAKLLESNPITIPNHFIAQEIARLKEQFQSRAKKKMELPDELFAEQAKRHVHLGLLLSTYREEKKLTTDSARLATAIDEKVSIYAEPEKAKAHYYSHQSKELQALELEVLEDMVMESLMAEADVKVKKIAMNEVKNLEGA